MTSECVTVAHIAMLVNGTTCETPECTRVICSSKMDILWSRLLFVSQTHNTIRRFVYLPPKLFARLAPPRALTTLVYNLVVRFENFSFFRLLLYIFIVYSVHNCLSLHGPACLLAEQHLLSTHTTNTPRLLHITCMSCYDHMHSTQHFLLISVSCAFITSSPPKLQSANNTLP